MTDARFNELLDELIGGPLPITLIINRLELALRYMIETKGVATNDLAGRFEDFVRQYRERETTEDES